MNWYNVLVELNMVDLEEDEELTDEDSVKEESEKAEKKEDKEQKKEKKKEKKGDEE